MNPTLVAGQSDTPGPVSTDSMPGVVGVPWASLRREPAPDAELVDECHLGYRVHLLEQEGDWWRIETSYGYPGWVSASQIVVEPELVTAWTEPLCWVTGAHADIQPVPSVHPTALLTAVRGGLLQMTGEVDGRWSGVRLPDDRAGWIRTGLITRRPSPVSHPSPELRERIVAAATEYLGVQYRWGGKGPDGIDCSGLAWMSYARNGLSVYRDAELRPPLRPILPAAAEPGDLLYFPGHVAISLGAGRIIHSSDRADGVRFASLNPNDPDYDADLADQVIGVGTAFDTPGRPESRAEMNDAPGGKASGGPKPDRTHGGATREPPPTAPA